MKIDQQEAMSLVRSGLTFTEVGARLGCTQEWVRQIALREGVSGLRIREERIESKVKARMSKMTDIEREFMHSLASYVSGDAEINYGIIYINGKTCIARNGFVHGRWIAINRPRVNAEFCAWRIAGDHGWLILPSDKWPTSQTMFGLSVKDAAIGPGLTYSKRHDWRYYINSWHQLGGEKMKILETINTAEVPSWRRDRGRYRPVINRILELNPGLAVPVECENTKEAQSLQYYIFGEQSRKDGLLSGKRFKVERRKNTVYVSLANGNGNGA